jgi:predicted dehydrogenase
MKIGVLGLGFMGSTHLQALDTIPGVEVAAVMDTNEARLSGDLSGILGNLGGPGRAMDFSRARRYRTVDEILADPELDAVDICLPTNFHAPVTIQALKAGKHVLTEKPMALDAGSAARMIEEADKQGRILMVAQVLRFMPAYERLAELVTSGRLGRMRSAFFRRRTATPTWGPWEFDSAQSGGGVFDLLIHDIDMSLHLFGEPESVSATGYEAMRGGIDQIVAELHYSGIGSVTVTGGWYHIGEYPFSMEYTVTGDKGVVEFNSAGRPAAVYWANGKGEALDCPDANPYREEVAYFVECCRNGRKPERCLPEESAKAVSLTRLVVEARGRRGERLACRG